MPDTQLAQRLLALFTSPACAEAITGDLAEGSGDRGSPRFWRQVLTTAMALGTAALTAAPLASVGVVVAGGTLFGSLAFTAFAPVALFPALLGSPIQWPWLSLAWWIAAFFTGFMLVHLSPARGMAASVVLALMGETAVTALRVAVPEGRILGGPDLLFYAIATLTAVPFVAGAIVARGRIIRAVAIPCLLLAMATPAWSQPAGWRDESSHKTTLVEVEDGVRLEVLDWGGSGRPLLLLPGLGDTAHVFDDVAPTLAKRYRVVAVSRRGHPSSSAPQSGYTLPQLAQDIVRVIDAVGLKNPVVVGHSFAGEEMHVLGARHADRIAGLVYVDAAFDRDDRFEEHEAAARAMPAAPRPEPADLTSFAALRAFLARMQGGQWPEARLRARYVANADGSIRGPWTPDRHVMQAYSAEMKSLTVAYAPERIRVPALAIYASPASASELMRSWYKADDPSIRERVETLYRTERENVARHARWFAAFAEGGRVAELTGGHDLFVSNPGEVVEKIVGFVASLPPTR